MTDGQKGHKVTVTFNDVYKAQPPNQTVLLDLVCWELIRSFFLLIQKNGPFLPIYYPTDSYS